MKIDILLGLQWGDEGKGKIVDAISPGYDIIARFQGGPNAGHSLEFNNVKHVLHLIPSGIFHPDKMNIIGNGVVIDPAVFKTEIETLNIPVEELTKRLIISSRANLILPGHRILDAAYENAKGCTKIGSTLKGIGPAYTDKVARNGLRAGEINSENFHELYEEHLNAHLSLAKNYDFEYDLKIFEKGWFEGVELMKKFKMNSYLAGGKKILAEGAQGTLLDIDFGSYPFVTSSNTISAGACTGLGVSPGSIGEVFGIFKAYCTRVGSGPFPTELNNETGERMRKAGNEFGSTTGRPRRCGWLDLPALKYAIMINGVTQLFMTKSDVLSGFDNIKVCTSYLSGGVPCLEIPFNNLPVEPVYIDLPGWKENISGVRTIEQLPENLKKFISFIEKETGVPVTMVSVGPDRKETIFV
jgi:adenylosuccinate synthase